MFDTKHLIIIKKARYYGAWPSNDPVEVQHHIADRLIEENCAVEIERDLSVKKKNHKN